MTDDDAGAAESTPDTTKANRTAPATSRTPATNSVNLADHMDGDDDDEESLDPDVETALEQGRERGTIRKTDDPLDPPEDDAFEADTDPAAAAASEDPEIPNVSGEQLDFDGLAASDDEEEWTWGQTKPTRTFTYKGMTVVMSEPDDDDEILNLLREESMAAESAGDDPERSQIDRLKQYAKLAIDQPTITDKRWEHGMTPTERLTIGSMAAQYLEGEDFTTAPEGGQTPQPD